MFSGRLNCAAEFVVYSMTGSQEHKQTRSPVLTEDSCKCAMITSKVENTHTMAMIEREKKNIRQTWLQHSLAICVQTEKKVMSHVRVRE